MITARNLTRSFDGVLAVEDVSFEIPEGKLFALLGPNGAGKTTTVRLLLGLIGASAGAAQVAGYDVRGDEGTRQRLRAACGLLTEAPGFYERMSAWDNLLFFGQLYRIPRAELADRLARYLRRMDLWERRASLVGTYSKGMKQRLAIIRAIFHDPKVIFLDEPTAGLDPEASLSVREMIQTLKDEGRTIVVCTHNLTEAERLADIVGILKRRLLVCDTLASLRTGAGRTTHVEIEVRAALEHHQRLLAALPGVTRALIERQKHLLEVSAPQESVPRIVKALVDAGAQIMAVRPQRPSLEAIYLRSVNEAGGAA